MVLIMDDNENELKITNSGDGKDTLQIADDREAKRIACIAESMNIIRTLNSHGVCFTVGFGLRQITFDISDHEAKMYKIIFKYTDAIVSHDQETCNILLSW